MKKRINFEGLQIDQNLYNLIKDEIAPGTGVSVEQFWKGFSEIVNEMAPRNSELLRKRDLIQSQIDEWHQQNRGVNFDRDAYKTFLNEIGYLVEEGDDFSIETRNVDSEIACIAGPQLVVPVSNARFALNAANARWGSLYDALYGTDAMGQGLPASADFDLDRARAVIKWAADFLDQSIALTQGSHAEVVDYTLSQKGGKWQIEMELSGGDKAQLADPSQFVGYNNSAETTVLLFVNNGLHVELQITRTDRIGELSRAGVKDVILESALSTIMDCEDSVAAVDAEDKVGVYRNWLGLMNGQLSEVFEKGGRTITRKLHDDRTYKSVSGGDLKLSGRSLLLVRNVGHLMTTDAVLDAEGNEIPEGMMDAMVTALCGMHDLSAQKQARNSRAGSIYIVKPKMHGPEEVAFTNELFGKVEQALGLQEYTLKVGVMDEERRTSANLKEAIRSVKHRLFFINTGFLDRTGDEIHTSMIAGAVYPKEQIKVQPWIAAYEDRNMDIGLDCGLQGRAQIGKGMWPMPDEMEKMLEVKVQHPTVGASCAWVPSPTAATLHAVHYHRVNVQQQQAMISGRNECDLDQLLTPPLMPEPVFDPEFIQSELDNNAQSILGYVVRWVNQGIGCSKVPDINNVGLMEDRATLRISSQLLANWLLHGICTDDQVMNTMERMASVVDRQNAGDSSYINMTPNFAESIAFQAACDLVFKGCEQPNGYTEPVLHQRRRELKASLNS